MPPIAEEKYGRKWAYLLSMIVQTFAYIGIYFTSSYNTMITMYSIVGLCAGGRVVIGVNYLTEFIEVKH